MKHSELIQKAFEFKEDKIGITALGAAMKEYTEQQIRLHLERAADMAEWGVHQNDDGQEPFHHSDNIFVDKESITSLPIILE